ncbi:DNA primase [uncultured Mucilaginibacter sp.]|uniref:DNA primase n=1 Tax=uncultured Mucilaginibacter sp. TaxID=797541 RepID=UPI002639ABA3|nr:DNA primase [uncultured Mucilaginibacter sp.]
MINKTTIDRIFEATDIVEVIGEFVQLKKRGANYVGLSPFANEKTPSFTVSPVKGIFKDFSSGLGGSAVTFLMEHEKFTYPEALKWLAKKYNIEVEEDKQTPENIEEDNRRESLMVVSAFAAKFFQQSLLETPEGQNIGLSYFKERGFREDIIRKFELGYSPDNWDAFSTAAIKQNYQTEFLLESGLSVKRDNGTLYDRYRGRVMFPIHSFTGRVVGFGGRTLKNDKSVPKYVNSPESEIYHKSNLLYGLYFAKKAIRESDNCYLVEGYADVISVHQAGIENVVASSGTSLTVEQIRLIGRSTKNITILYDGDAAGIKAALRGLDLILEEGLNVKVVTFPDGHDPDSFVRKVGTAAFKTYIDQNQKDFILYKTSTLLSEAKNDPIKKAEVIREIVESIAKIPDSIKASVFVKECSLLLQMDERSLLTELNKMRQAKAKKQDQSSPKPIQPETEYTENIPVKTVSAEDTQEKEIVRLLITYGNKMIDWDGIANTYIGPFMISELSDVEFENPESKNLVDIYRQELENGRLPDEAFFIHHPDRKVTDLAVSMISTPYVLSENWYEKHKILVSSEEDNMKATILGAIFHLKKRKVDQILEGIRRELQKTTSNDDIDVLLNQYQHMKKVEKNISDFLGSVILK